MANFIGFEPAEYQKKMKLLDDVIRLKAKNKDAAEVSQGYQVEAAQKAAQQAKPIRDELQRQNALMLSFRSNKDILEAKQQLAQAKQLKDAADVDAQANPNDQGYAELALAYGLQLAYAESKLKLLEAMRDSLKAKLQYEKQLKIKEVENRMDEYQEAMDNFMEAEIPVGFIQVVDIRTLPQQPQVVPGAPQVPVNQPQALPAPGEASTAEEFFLEMFAYQQPQGRMELDDNLSGVIFFVSSPGAPGPVTMRDINGNNPIEGIKIMINGVFGLRFENGMGNTSDINARTLRVIVETSWDQLPEDALKKLIILYVKMYQPKERFSLKDDFVKLEIKPLVDQNPEYKKVITELSKTKGSGILGDIIETIGEKTGILARKPKRGPPKLRLGPNGEYGNVRVDMPALLNRGRVRVMRGGAIVLDEVEENVDGFGLGRLITKRVMQKTIDAAPPKVRKQYERLNKLANAAEQITKKAGNTKGSGKITKTLTKKPQIIVVGNDADLAQRLKIAVGEYGAGNDSSENIQLITELAKKMMDLGKISSDRYRQIVESIA